MKSCTRLLAAVLMVLVIALGAPAISRAEGAAAISQNNNAQAYSYGRYGKTVNSYLVPQSDGTFIRVEYMSSGTVVETYSADFKLLSQKTIENELPIFGGFYAGANYNYFVFGQENLEEANDAEVMRVVKYTKDFQRVASQSVFGANTYIPFDAGSLRMTEHNGLLCILTCHEMYAEAGESIHHQAAMYFDFAIDTLKPVYSFYDVGHPDANGVYISHSFNQFILSNGDKIVLLHHGDAYHRGLCISEVTAQAGKTHGQFSGTKVVYPISGTKGNNTTNTWVAGFEQSGSSYLIAGTSVDHKSTESTRPVNVFVTATDKSNVSEANTRINWLTDYQVDDNIALSVPQMVKISDDQFLVLWCQQPANQYQDTYNELHYRFVNGQGAPVSEEYTAKAMLSDCKPVLSGNKVVWYVTDQTEPIFYSINLSDPSTVETRPVVNHVMGISIDQPEVSVVVGKTVQLKAILDPADAENQKVTWSSEWDALATVDENGLVTAKAKGTVYIYATSEDMNRKASCKVTILPLEYEEPTYTWEPYGSGYKVTGKAICTNNEEKSVEETKTAYSSVVTQATCEEAGERKYTAYFSTAPLTNQTKNVPIEPLGHNYKTTWTWTSETLPGTSQTIYTGAHASMVCTRDSSHTHEEDAQITTAYTAPACTTSGKTVYTASVTVDGKEYTNQKTVTIPSLGHQYGEQENIWEETENGFNVTAIRICENDPEHVLQETKAAYLRSSRAATCTEDGYQRYSVSFSNYYLNNATKEVTLPALGHEWVSPVWTWTKDHQASVKVICSRNSSHTQTVKATVTSQETPATCLENGEIVYTATAVIDGVTYTDETRQAVPALGHAFGEPVYSWNWNGDVYEVTGQRICSRDSAHVTAETTKAAQVHTTLPTCETTGLDTFTATFTDTTYQTQVKTEEVPALGHDWKEEAWTWSEDYQQASVKLVCVRDRAHVHEMAAEVKESRIEPGEKEAGKIMYTATAVFEGVTYQSVKEIVLWPTALSYEEPVYTWTEISGAAGTAVSYEVKAEAICKDDAAYNITETVTASYRVVKAASCAATGEGCYTAVFENNLFQQQEKRISLPALSHTPQALPAVAASCTEAGLTEGSKCSVCGTVLKAQEVVPALGHKAETIHGKAATCTAEGLTDGKKCKVCGEILEEQLPVPKAEHTAVKVSGKAATCTLEGLTDGKKCKVCGEILEAQQSIPKIAHTAVEDPAVDPTYTKTGLSAGSHCSVCGEVLTAQQVIPVNKLVLSGLKAEAAGKYKVKLTWDQNPEADGYLIYGQKNGTYAYVGMVGSGTRTTFTDTKALGADYNFYWVFPYVQDETGKMFPGTCPKYVFAKGVCVAVTNLKAASVKGAVKLSWSPSPEAEGYLVYGITGGKPYGYIGMTTVTGTTGGKAGAAGSAGNVITFTHTKATTDQYNYYWIFPYFKDENGKMIVGLTGKYTYGRAQRGELRGLTLV